MVPTVALAASDKATPAPANWSSLESSKVMLSTVHDGKSTTRALANKARARG